MLVGCSCFDTGWGGIQIQIYNHIKNSQHEYVIFSDAKGSMHNVLNSLPNVKEIVYCKDHEISEKTKSFELDGFIHHTVNHTVRTSIKDLEKNKIPILVFHHCAFVPVYDASNITSIITTSNNNIEIMKQNKTFKDKYIHKLHLSLDTDKFDYIINELNLKKIRKRWRVPLKSTVIGRIGRIEPSKCPEDFIKAAGLLKEKSKEPLFFIIGGTIGFGVKEDYLKSLKDLVKKSGLEEGKDIIFTGELTEEDKIGLLNIFDIVLYPTRWEGYCMAFLEAMYCGVPIVTYDNFANKETVGEGGICVKDADVKELVNSINKILEEKELKRKLSESGRNIVIKRNGVKYFAGILDSIISMTIGHFNVLPAIKTYGDNETIRLNQTTEEVIINSVVELEKELNVCMIGYGLVNNMESSPEYLQLKYLLKNGVNVDFFCITPDGISSFEKTPINRGVNFDPSLLSRKPDVIHVHHVENPLTIQALKYAAQEGIPTVMNIHSWTQPISHLDGMVDKYVVFSDKEYHHRKSYTNSSKLDIIPNGIELKRYVDPLDRCFPKDKMNILFVGQFFDWKGIYNILEAAIYLKNDKSILFHMATHVLGEYEKLVGKISEYELTDKIILYPSSHGQRMMHELIAMYQSCDVFLLPTEMDCYPTTVLEAMACSKPVIASNCGGIPNQIDNDISGIHIPACGKFKNQFIADAIEKLKDVELREKMGRVGRMKVENSNDIKINIQKYIEIYRKLIK